MCIVHDVCMFNDKMYLDNELEFQFLVILVILTENLELFYPKRVKRVVPNTKKKSILPNFFKR